MPFWFRLLLIALCSAAWAWGQSPVPAWEQMYQQIRSPDSAMRQQAMSQLVGLLVPQLADDDAEARSLATVRLQNLPGAALPLVEAKLKQADSGPEARLRLEGLLPVLRKRAALDKAYEPRTRWLEATTLGAYRKVGHHDARWGKAAEESLRLFYSPDPNTVQDQAINAALNDALRAGCDDPLILYCRACTYARDADHDPTELTRLYSVAAEAIGTSSYPASRKALAYADFADCSLRLDQSPYPVDDDRLSAAVALLPEVAKEPSITGDDIYFVAQRLFDACRLSNGNRKAAFDRVYPELDRAMPGSPLPLLFKGSVYTEYAWDARGGGWAYTVTEEGWRLMEERLQIAEQSLQEALKRDPDDWHAPSLMLGVELGQGKGRETMELWFKRAMEAYPDNRKACERKLYYLEPKWHGDAAEMLRFGRQLLAEENWYADLPFVLLSAHERLAAYEKDPHAYYQEPKVWEDIRSIYQRDLKLYPWDTKVRSQFAKWACVCGQWQEAANQFRILGDRAQVKEFGGQPQYEYYRKKALKRATP